MKHLTSSPVADESEKTKKAREKLKNFFSKIDQQITQEARHLKIKEIHEWIARRASQRVTLKNKDIQLFDSNRNIAPESLKVVQLAKELRGTLEREIPHKDL